jgi:hypothetical protein
MQVCLLLILRYKRKSETRIVCGGHVYYWIGTKLAIFIEDLPLMLPTNFRIIWKSGFRGEDFLEIDQSETRTRSSIEIAHFVLIH